MGIMKKIGDLVSPNDPELVEKTLARLDEQDRWNDVFSTNSSKYSIEMTR